MRYRPRLPLEFARPYGNAGDADMRSSRAVSAQFAGTLTARAVRRRSRPSLSTYTTPEARPFALVSTRTTVASVRTSQRPVAIALGITVTSDDPFAPNSHP